MRRNDLRIALPALLSVAVSACASPPSMPAPDGQALPQMSRLFESPIYYFAGPPDGDFPIFGHLTLDGSGNLLGATNEGGTGACKSHLGVRIGCGTVFELQRKPSGTWSERVLYSFKNLPDGAGPRETLTLDASGDIFGVTIGGGNRGCLAILQGYRGCGTAFELIPAGKERWTKRTLHVFSGGLDGGTPISGLVLDVSGNLYGVTYCGGPQYSCYPSGSGAGVFYQLSRNASGGWSEATLHAFGIERGDGAFPFGDLTANGALTIYGTTAGTVYEMTRSSPSSPWNETTLFSFPTGSQGGFYPKGGLALDAAGNLYGTTYSGGGGSCDCGVVFELSRSASGAWTETVLHVFSGGLDGKYSWAGLAIDPHGELFGTTVNGGDPSCNNGSGCGVVFSVRPHGTNSEEKVLHAFEEDATDGGLPFGAVILDRAGNLFGTTEYGGAASNFGKGTTFEVSR